MVSGTLDYVVCMGWGIYVTKCKQELGFLWKFNVVLGSCGEKTLRRRKASGLKRDFKMIWPLRNLKPLFDEKGMDLSDYMTKLRWPLVHASEKLWECIYHSIYVCFVFWLSCALVFLSQIVMGIDADTKCRVLKYTCQVPSSCLWWTSIYTTTMVKTLKSRVLPTKWKGALNFSTLIVLMLPNLDKYSGGRLALEQHHKIGKTHTMCRNLAI
jgi:hypothetical protein